jgi:hypothetical protein
VAQEQSDVERAAALADVIERRLNNQYRVIYEAPPSLTPPASTEIVTRRPELRVRVTGIPQNRR